MPKAQRKKAHSLSGWEPSTEGVLSTGKKGIIGAGNCQQRAGPGRRTAASPPDEYYRQGRHGLQGVGSVEHSEEEEEEEEEDCLFLRIAGILTGVQGFRG